MGVQPQNKKREGSLRDTQNIEYFGTIPTQVRVLIPAALHQRPQPRGEIWMCGSWRALAFYYGHNSGCLRGMGERNIAGHG